MLQASVKFVHVKACSSGHNETKEERDRDREGGIRPACTLRPFSRRCRLISMDRPSVHATMRVPMRALIQPCFHRSIYLQQFRSARGTGERRPFRGENRLASRKLSCVLNAHARIHAPMYPLGKRLYCKWILSCTRITLTHRARACACARAVRVSGRIKLGIKSAVAAQRQLI